MKKCLLIVNPCSGRQRITGEQRISTELLDIIKTLNENDYDVSVCVTLRHNHARELAATHSADLIICTGGDGTLSQVISGLIDANKYTPIGYIPRGSTNDYANTLGLSFDYKTALLNIINGKQCFVDVGKFGGSEYFNYVASFGIFTAASYNTPQEMKNVLGNAAYFFGGLADLVNAKEYRIKVNANGKEIQDKYVLGLVMNTTSVGGMIKMKPDTVDLSDGLFEIVLVKNPQDLNDCSRILEGFISSKFDDPIFTFIKSNEIEFTFDEPISWSLDGEEKQVNKSVKIQNLQKRTIFLK